MAYEDFDKIVRGEGFPDPVERLSLRELLPGQVVVWDTVGNAQYGLTVERKELQYHTPGFDYYYVEGRLKRTGDGPIDPNWPELQGRGDGEPARLIGGCDAVKLHGSAVAPLNPRLGELVSGQRAWLQKAGNPNDVLLTRRVVSICVLPDCSV